MADKTENVKTRVKFDGEEEYKAACKDIGNNLKNLNSEMRRVTAEYKGNENSIEALKAKQDVLSERYDEQAKKVEETRKALERCTQQTSDNSEATQKLQRDLNYAEAALLDTQNALRAVENELTEGVQAQRQYEEACQGIDRNLSLLGAELQEVTAKYRSNEDSAKAVAEKQEILKRTYDEQAKKVAETEKAYESMARQYGETSREAQELEAQMHRERAALYDLESQLEEAGRGHRGLASVMGDLSGAMEKGVAALGAATAAIGAAVVAGLGYAVRQADEAKGALNDFCAATGTATEDAGQYRQAMENIYSANFGEGFEDIAAAMAEVRQQAGDLGADGLEKMTASALALRDTFDMDVAESTRAATQLMKKFGLSGDEAYSLIAQGAQNGLNRNGDLLDVINEYSNQYSQAGLSAEDMFNSIANGAETGVWSIDKMGDAFKEFSIRMNDGTANGYLASLGLNADEVVGKFQKGGDSAKEAMSQVSEALKNCDDKTLQYTAGVGLMGTMWEDMGADACTSLMDVEGQISKAADAMGKINAVKYDTFSEAMQGAGRILQTSFIMPIGERALPIFSQFANRLAQGAAEAGGDMGKLAQSFGEALGNMANELAEMLPQITDFAAELVSGLVDGIVEAMPTLAEGAVQIIAGLAKGLGEALPELIPSAADAALAIADTLIGNAPMLIDAALQLVTGLADGIVAALPVIIERLPQIITSIMDALAEGLPLILESAGEIVAALAEGIAGAMPLLVAAAPQIAAAIAEGLIAGLPKIAEAAMHMQAKAREAMGALLMGIAAALKEAPQTIWNCIIGAVPKVAMWGLNMLTKAKEAMNSMVTGIVTVAKEIPQKIYNSISAAISKVAQWGAEVRNRAVEGMRGAVSGVTGAFAGIGGAFSGIGRNMAEGIWNGISGAAQWIKGKIRGWVGDVMSFIKDLFGIKSPSARMRDEVGVYLAQGIGVGFAEEMEGVRRQMEASMPKEFDVGAKVSVSESYGHETDGGWRPKKPNPKGGGAAGGFTVIQNIYANTTDYAKQQKEAARQFRMIARTV